MLYTSMIASYVLCPPSLCAKQPLEMFGVFQVNHACSAAFVEHLQDAIVEHRRGIECPDEVQVIPHADHLMTHDVRQLLSESVDVLQTQQNI